MKIYVVRHGQTDWNKQGIIQGNTDIPLNDTGIKQAYKTKQLLDDITFDCMYCSPLIRAIQTADIINEGHEYEMLLDARLKERNFGVLEGSNIKDVDFKELWDINTTENIYREELASTFHERIYHFLKYIIKKDYTNVVIVAHGGVSLPIYAYFKGLTEQSDYLSYMLKNCEVAYYDTTNL